MFYWEESSGKGGPGHWTHVYLILGVNDVSLFYKLKYSKQIWLNSFFYLMGPNLPKYQTMKILNCLKVAENDWIKNTAAFS